MTPVDDDRSDDRLDELVHRADIDGLVRLVDDRTASRDWDGLLRARDRTRHALRTGRQLWPVATLATYRLALLAPAPWAAAMLDTAGPASGDGHTPSTGGDRFTIGPLTEVIAQHHSWEELGPLLAGPAASIVAHERTLRGDTIRDEPNPNALDLPYGLEPWEPAYCLATYSDEGVDAPPPSLPPRDDELVLRSPDAERLDDPAVELAVRELVEPWTAQSNGRAEVTCVAGSAADAVRGLGIARAALTPVSLDAALSWMAWAGASGGAHGRRRGAALGRFGALWTLAALLDADSASLDELGELAVDLDWFWWDAGEPVTGWRLQLAIADPAEHVAWAISARDES